VEHAQLRDCANLPGNLMAERDDEQDDVSGAEPLLPLSAFEKSLADVLTADGYDAIEVRRVLRTLRLAMREREVRELCGQLSSIERRRVYRKVRDSNSPAENIAKTLIHRRHIETLVGGEPLSPKELNMLTLAEGKSMSEEQIVVEILRKRSRDL
jgi:hypothetical protein